MFDNLKLDNNVVLITGANRGIGLSIAKLLKLRGAKVIATARKKEDSQILEAMGFISHYLDVTEVDSIIKLKKTLKLDSLMPDILVSNAGLGTVSLSMRLKRNLWDQTIETNLTAAFELAKAFIPHMSKKGFGRIINISSVLARSPQVGLAHYSASKSGLEGFTKSLALEYAQKGITANCIAPGFIETDMIADLRKQGMDFKNKIPVERVGVPDDVAEITAFLSSKASSYITGETIHINGGTYFS